MALVLWQAQRIAGQGQNIGEGRPHRIDIVNHVQSNLLLDYHWIGLGWLGEECMRKELICAIWATIFASGAHAAVITFDGLALDGNGSTPPFQANTVTVGDYKFTGVGGSAQMDFEVFAKNDPRNADPGGAALGLTEINLTYTMSRIDGAVFSISAIDISQLFNDASGGGYSGLVSFSYDGVPAESYSHDGVPGYQTFALSGAGIHTLGIRTINFIAIDNLVVSDSATSAPEPATWAMFIGGFGLIGAAMRKRQRITAVGL